MPRKQKEATYCAAEYGRDGLKHWPFKGAHGMRVISPDGKTFLDIKWSPEFKAFEVHGSDPFVIIPEVANCILVSMRGRP